MPPDHGTEPQPGYKCGAQEPPKPWPVPGPQAVPRSRRKSRAREPQEPPVKLRLMNAPIPPRKRPHPRESSFNSYQALRRRGLLHTPARPGSLLRQRGVRLIHPSYRRSRPSDTGG